jgi:transcriptional regulator with XRE-family HTH domain
MQGVSYMSEKGPYNPAMPMGRPTTKARTPMGERIASAREQAGLTQKQLAEKLGTSQRVVTYWEREPVALKAEQLSALAEALGVSGDFLLGRDAAKPRGQGPAGRLRLLFERASKLSRAQQAKVAEFVEPFVERQEKTG